MGVLVYGKLLTDFTGSRIVLEPINLLKFLKKSMERLENYKDFLFVY